MMRQRTPHSACRRWTGSSLYPLSSDHTDLCAVCLLQLWVDCTALSPPPVAWQTDAPSCGVRPRLGLRLRALKTAHLPPWLLLAEPVKRLPWPIHRPCVRPPVPTRLLRSALGPEVQKHPSCRPGRCRHRHKSRPRPCLSRPAARPCTGRRPETSLPE